LSRKLGRATNQRIAILKGLVTSLVLHGEIVTTASRAKEARKIAEKLIAMSVRELDNITRKNIKVTSAKVDGSNRKITQAKTSKNGKKYWVVVREWKGKEVTIDNPSRLYARRLALKWLYKVEDEEKIGLTNVLFDKIAPKYKDRNGGYTRIYKIGPRAGDGAEMVILKLV